MSIGLVIIGVDHGTAPACLVERIREREAFLGQAVAELCGHSMNEAFLIKLPRHTEVLVCNPDPVAASSAVLSLLTTVVSLRSEDWSAFHRYVNDEAIAHLLSVTAGADGEDAAAQLQLCWEQSQRTGVGDYILRELTDCVKAQSYTVGDGPDYTESSRSMARQLWSRLQAESSLPESTRIRKEVDSICAQEIAIFRRRCGGLMTEEQERAVKIVTARISERVGEWITRTWNDSLTARQEPANARSSRAAPFRLGSSQPT